MSEKHETPDDSVDEGRKEYFMDIDRMTNEGLGGGNVTMHNGLIEESTTETMKRSDSVMQHPKKEKK